MWRRTPAAIQFNIQHSTFAIQPSGLPSALALLLFDRDRSVHRRHAHVRRAVAEVDTAIVVVVPGPAGLAAGFGTARDGAVAVGVDGHTAVIEAADLDGKGAVLRLRLE